MEDVAARVAALRSRVEQAKRAADQAEYAREHAEHAAATAVAALESEFGVSTPAQALELRAALDRQIADEVARVESALNGQGLDD